MHYCIQYWYFYNVLIRQISTWKPTCNYIYTHTVYTCKLQNQCKHASEISIFISLSLNTTNVFLALNSKHTHRVRIESLCIDANNKHSLLSLLYLCWSPIISLYGPFKIPQSSQHFIGMRFLKIKSHVAKDIVTGNPAHKKENQYHCWFGKICMTVWRIWSIDGEEMHCFKINIVDWNMGLHCF